MREGLPLQVTWDLGSGRMHMYVAWRTLAPFSSPVLITVHQLLTWQQFSASAPGMEQAGELELLMEKFQ